MQELLRNYQLLYYILILLSSVLITLLAIPSILHVAVKRHLYDDLGHFRKQHDHGIPRLGGVAIFVGFIVTLLLFCVTANELPLNYLLAACVILFAMGLKDDLSGVNASTKFVVQFIVSAILVIPGHIQLTSMYGVLGIYHLSYVSSACFSILTIMLIINAFNLIDGVDGLAGGLGLISSLVFGIFFLVNGLAGTTGIIANGAFACLFIYIHQYELASVCLAMVGALLAFLRYNFTPAKMFMGDTGSLLLGLVSIVMAIKFIEVSSNTNTNLQHINSVPALTIAILIGPIFDTFRVFVLRIINKKSPFQADRNHIHHRILDLGFNHMQTTLILAGSNILCIFMAITFTGFGSTVMISIIGVASMLFNWSITFAIRCKERQCFNLKYLFA